MNNSHPKEFSSFYLNKNLNLSFDYIYYIEKWKWLLRYNLTLIIFKLFLDITDYWDYHICDYQV